jgi:hypothetical protein
MKVDDSPDPVTQTLRDAVTLVEARTVEIDLERILAQHRSRALEHQAIRLHRSSLIQRSSRPAWVWLAIVAVLAGALVIGFRASSAPTVTPKQLHPASASGDATQRVAALFVERTLAGSGYPTPTSISPKNVALRVTTIGPNGSVFSVWAYSPNLENATSVRQALQTVARVLTELNTEIRTTEAELTAAMAAKDQTEVTLVTKARNELEQSLRAEDGQYETLVAETQAFASEAPQCWVTMVAARSNAPVPLAGKCGSVGGSESLAVTSEEQQCCHLHGWGTQIFWATSEEVPADVRHVVFHLAKGKSLTVPVAGGWFLIVTSYVVPQSAPEAYLNADGQIVALGTFDSE